MCDAGDNAVDLTLTDDEDSDAYDDDERPDLVDPSLDSEDEEQSESESESSSDEEDCDLEVEDACEPSSASSAHFAPSGKVKVEAACEPSSAPSGQVR